MGLHGLLRGQLYFLYVDDVRASQKTHIWDSTACCGDSLFVLYPIRLDVRMFKYLRRGAILPLLLVRTDFKSARWRRLRD
jgi:hypothetical protein